MFTYGSLLLMVGYTNIGLQQITGLKGARTIWLALSQSVALAIGNYLLKFLLRKFNIRTILFFSYVVVFICLILISQLDHLSGAVGSDPSRVSQTRALVLYLIITFIFGLGLAPTAPINSIYLATHFQGKKRAGYLSASSGVYSLGGGIIPLAFAALIYHLQVNASFDHLRFFYYIAIGLAVFGMMMSCATFHQATRESLHLKNLATDADGCEKNFFTRRSFMLITTLVVVMFSFFMLSETFGNYSLTNFIQNSQNDAGANAKIIATQCGGLFLVVQGIWRCTSGVTFAKWFRYRTFLSVSTFFIMAAFSCLTAHILDYSLYYGFLVAFLLGIGVGNMWSIMLAYVTAIDNKKASFMGVVVNTTTMASTALFQLVGAYLYLLNPTVEVVVGIASAVILLGFIWLLSWYLKYLHHPHEDDVYHQRTTTAQVLPAEQLKDC